jgi:hypothetical protein
VAGGPGQLGIHAGLRGDEGAGEHDDHQIQRQHVTILRLAPPAASSPNRNVAGKMHYEHVLNHESADNALLFAKRQL